MGYCNQHGLYIRYCKRCLTPACRTLTTRFDELKASPWLVNQDAFGICGMASALYLLLKQPDKKKAEALFDATFAAALGQKAKFKVANKEHEIPFKYVARRYFNRMLNLKQGGNDFTANLVDFGMCRALGYLFKVIHPTKYQAEKSAIWAHVEGGDVPKTRHSARMQGNLPLRTNALGHILYDILEFSVPCIAYNWKGAFGYTSPAQRKEKMGGDLPKEVTYEPFASVDKFFEIFNRRRPANTMSTTFSVAGIKALTLVKDPKLGKDFGDTEDGLFGEYDDVTPALGPTTMRRQTTLTATNREVAGDPYDHWVVIESVSRVPPNKVRVKLWTWAVKLELTLTEDAFLHAVHDVIFGEV